MSDSKKLQDLENDILINLEDALAQVIRLERYEEDSDSNFYAKEHYMSVFYLMKNLLKTHFSAVNSLMVGSHVLEAIISHMLEEDEDFIIKTRDEQSILKQVQDLLK